MTHSYQALIIDDDTGNSEVLYELLSSESVTCKVIQDPRLIQNHMEKQTPPDVIFLDLEMPHIDGYEVLDLFKSDPQWSSVPVVACTIHVNEVQVAKSKDFHSFIAKPLDMDAFPSQLQRILNDEPVWEIGRMQ